MKLFSTLKQILQGKSITRIYLNQYLENEILVGKTIDVGGGWNADYISSIPKTSDCELVTFDIKNGVEVDFETDVLPAADGSYDTVLFFNVLEHIYNHQHICGELIRITKKGGSLIGFVPFLMWYHPDHSDYFRYTHEALAKIIKNAGGKTYDIKAIGGGPFIAASHMIIQSFPRFLRVIVFLPFWFLDSLYRFIKGNSYRSYALGYIFKVKV